MIRIFKNRLENRLQPVTHGLCVLFLLLAFSNTGFSQKMAQESAYDRVLRTGTLRCGYLVWQPYFMKDPNSGQFSGVNYDLIEVMGKVLNLKIEWTQEFVLGQQVEALKSGKIDAVCFDGSWTRSAMPYLAYSKSLFYIPIHLWISKNNTHLAKNSLDAFNVPTVRFSAMDGDLSSDLAQALFPKAELLTVTSSADPTTLMVNVATGKAQALFQDAAPVEAFNKNNPDAPLISVNKDEPIAIYPNFVSTLPEERALIDMLDRSIDFMNDTGQIDLILGRYDPAFATLLPPSKNYAYPVVSKP